MARNHKNQSRNQQSRNKENNTKIPYKSKSWFFEPINKTDRPLAQITKGKKERTQLNKIRNEQKNITTDSKEIQNIIKDYLKP